MTEGKFESTVPKKLEVSDIEPVLSEIGGTQIVLQRHEKYERSLDHENTGSLTNEGAERASAQGTEFFHKLFAMIPESERQNVDVLVLASDTKYNKKGQRSMETANLIIEALHKELEELHLQKSQLLNVSKNVVGNGEARPTSRLREPLMFEVSPEFVTFLKEKYGDLSREFWIAFEEDKEIEKRNEMGAEGPDEISNRIQLILDILARYSRLYHRRNPNKRLVIWATTHYDTISPYVKREILKTSKDIPLGVDYGAGVVINLDKAGKGSVTIEETPYTVPLKTVNQSPK